MSASALPAIRVDHVSKRYVIDHEKRPDTLRDALTGGVRALFSRLRAQQTEEEEFWALRDVSFEVQPGEVVGIIGRNGAGKSTLLKILSRITEPTQGRIALHGRVASLLEVGTGFHPELSGRENIFLNGAILGMRREEIRRKFDEIVAFAEVERFLDTPVKRYSSGMYVRLAFAVAAHLEPEILIVDEVLAVGDVQFQQKCLGKMREVSRNEGRTVLFVSHQMGAVRELCSRAILLKQGSVSRTGPVADVVAEYLGLAGAEGHGFSQARRLEGTGDARISDATLLVHENATNELLSRDPVIVCLKAEVQRETRIAVECLLRGPDGLPLALHAGGLVEGRDHRLAPGKYEFRFELQLPQLAAGRYTMDLMLADSGVRFHDYLEHALRFQITPRQNDHAGWQFQQQDGQGSFLLRAHHQDPRRLS
ncbi:MAG: ABC transporter ATP-binding protein [Candidatus Didemnitutus sp.]|nr:ABC transporter ATP-binding protein [Candidatus Didemnitutus sp.]